MPGFRTSYIISDDNLTLTDRKQLIQAAEAMGVARAIQKSIIRSAAEARIRHFENARDIAGIALDQYNTAALAAVGTDYSVFQAVNSPVLAQTKILVVYGVAIETTPIPVNIMTFRTGGILGNIVKVFDLEQLVNAWTSAGFFSEPVVVENQETFAVTVRARFATGALARVQLRALVIEPSGYIP